jgi:hypothetical protein
MRGNQPSVRKAPLTEPMCHEGSCPVSPTNATFRLVNPECAFKDKSFRNFVVIKGNMGGIFEVGARTLVITTVQLKVAGVTRQICE